MLSFKKVDFLSQMNGRVVQDKGLSTLNVIYFYTLFTLIELIKLDLLSSFSIIKYKYIKGTDDGAQVGRAQVDFALFF